jgi:hypothetical protein
LIRAIVYRLRRRVLARHLALTFAVAPALAVVALSLSGCPAGRAPTRTKFAPGVAFPTTLGEGHGDGDEPLLAEPTPAASGSAAPATPGSSASPPSAPASAEPPPGPPDPEPLRLAEQWEYELASKGGKVSVLAVHPRRFARPVVTPRRFGRVAIELWIGSELVERVRFDFPGLALEHPEKPAARRPLYAPTDLGRGADVRQRVLVPAAPRARKAVLLDRATGESWPLPWPPDSPTPSPAPAASAAPAMD